VISKTPKPLKQQVRVTFSLPVGEPADRVSVVGDFNGWQPNRHPLRKRANGRRSCVVELPSGAKARFRYVTANGHWFDDTDADAFEPNGHGGHDGIVLT
jgi:1,4-alpha-glucan branching enzyme